MRAGVEHHPSERRHLPGAIPRARRLRQEMTEVERRLWSRLRALNLGFRRQAPMGRYIVDFAQHAAKLVVELDGGQHADARAMAYDAERTAWLESRGYRVLRFWNSEVVENIEGVLETILRWSPPPQPSPVKGEGVSGALTAPPPSTGEVGAIAPGGGPLRSPEA